MRRKRPCRVCRKWFLPHPRAGSRQKVCSAEACQRERHRRNCADWRDRHPDYDRETRLRARLGPDPGTEAVRPALDPVGEIAWEAARDAVGLEAAVITQVTAEVVVSWARDVVGWEALGITRESPRHVGRAARDEIGREGPAP
jgi:hypothetical protein